MRASARKMSHFPRRKCHIFLLQKKEKGKKKALHIHAEMCSVSVFIRVDAVLSTYLCEFAHARVSARTPTLVRGSFDAFLSGPAQFALFVFNDASREADSRRVERAAFDVSDYDITDVKRRSGDPRAPSHIPVAHYSERTEGEIDRGGEGKIKYLARTRMRFCANTKCVANGCFCLCFGSV